MCSRRDLAREAGRALSGGPPLLPVAEVVAHVVSGRISSRRAVAARAGHCARGFSVSVGTMCIGAVATHIVEERAEQNSKHGEDDEALPPGATSRQHDMYVRGKRAGGKNAEAKREGTRE